MSKTQVDREIFWDADTLELMKKNGELSISLLHWHLVYWRQAIS
ncbi:MAG: hypothetical protein OQK73_04970 [Gammaproteobacteria bacterium]|nr:hypothetical protein [Gammaproteobacteria bacterium]